jgi:putative MATE family efflux protein
MNLFKSEHLKALYQQTMPMLIGLIAIMGSQLVDSAFIGQLGAQPLAVLGFSIPIFQVVIGIQVGLGIATTASISNALGANRVLYAKHLGALVLFIGAITITVLCFLLWYFQELIASFLGADVSLFQLLRSYWFPWLISCWLGAILYFGYSICRSHGESATPGRVMVITSVLNVILDPIFIFTLDFGLAGAAWATCIAYSIGCFIIFKAILRKQFIALLDDLERAKKGINTIIKFTIPAMLSQFMPPISAMLVTVIIASYGDFAIGAWGLANRFELISIILILALTMALPPIIGKLRGANKTHEIYQLVKATMGIVISLQLVLTLLILITAKPISHLLTNDAEIISVLQSFLWVVPISYGALGVCMLSVSACNAMGLPAAALMISILRLFGCYLPLIWIGSQLYGLQGIFIGAAIGNILSGLMGWFLFKKQFHQMIGTSR